VDYSEFHLCNHEFPQIKTKVTNIFIMKKNTNLKPSRNTQCFFGDFSCSSNEVLRLARAASEFKNRNGFCFFLPKQKEV